ncbi:hypothetical protein [Actinomadura flavalba]|uniref:hypothetical protein n=1 Tax=Actinomadura flavalba TaxID=1120938 RepID=UPI0003655716|nr:hypothetical protein [Actinomadura flavalba]
MASSYGFRQLAEHLGLSQWQLRLAGEHGLVPAPDVGDHRWSLAGATACAERKASVLEAFGADPPLGAVRAAERLAGRLVLDVEKADIEVLAARGDLAAAGAFRGHPIYLPRDLDAVPERTLHEIVDARKGPLAGTLDARGAARALGIRPGRFGRLAAELSLRTDTGGRHVLAHVRALAADGGLMDRLRCETEQHRRAQAVESERTAAELLRTWLARCTAYLDGSTDHSPDLAAAGRALRALGTARASLRALEPAGVAAEPPH